LAWGGLALWVRRWRLLRVEAAVDRTFTRAASLAIDDAVLALEALEPPMRAATRHDRGFA
jgi:hypothetical protein